MNRTGVVLAMIAALASGGAAAQSALGGFGTTRELPPLPGTLPSGDGGGLATPAPAPRSPGTGSGTAARVLLREVRFEGNTVFGDAALAPLVADLVGRAVTLEEIEAARLRLTRHYIEAGFVSSGVLLPERIEDGVLRFQVVEGRLVDIRVSGEDVGEEYGFGGQLDPGYVSSRLELPEGQPLDIEALRERFGLLLEDEHITRMRGKLRPGPERGDAILDVEVFTRDPLFAAASINNHHTVSTGAIGGDLDFRLFNLTGRGDVTSANLEITKGRFSGIARYEMPVTPDNITPFIEGEYSDSRIIEKPFDDLDIENQYWRLTAGVRWPVYRSREDEVALTFAFDHKQSETTLLGIPFPPPGTADATVKASVLRFSQEWVRREPDQVFALRSNFSLGIDIFDATKGVDGGPDASFFAWLGQAQYVRLLSDRVRLVTRVQAQLAPDPLFSFEQVGLGGIDTVRGYRENALVTDNALIASLEVPIHVYDMAVPGLTPAGFMGPVEIRPFVDYGAGWSARGSFGSRTDLLGIGAGLHWRPRPGMSIDLVFAHPLEDLNRDIGEDDLTDEAVYLSVTLATP